MPLAVILVLLDVTLVYLAVKTGRVRPWAFIILMVPGIGGLAYAGIPVTHRDTNHAVTFITGHGIDGKLTELDWAAVSRGAPTLVFYMGRKFVAEIAQALMDAGRAANEPAVIVANAARRVAIAAREGAVIVAALLIQGERLGG